MILLAYLLAAFAATIPSLISSSSIHRGQFNAGLDVQQVADATGDFKIEVEEVGPPLLEERTNIIGQELEERAFTVGRQQGIPMQMPPVAMVADANIFHLALGTLIALYGHGEGLQSVCRGNDTAVAVGLLDKMVVLLQQTAPRAVQFLVPLHGTEVG